jgi:chaperone BCS1
MDLHVEFKNASRYQARELFNRFYLPTEASTMEYDAEEGETATDSGYDSSEALNIKDTQSGVIAGSEKTDTTLDLPFTGTTHTGRAPKLSRVRIAKLAEGFADAIPERECSMASLQGYLMAYKTRPVEAASEAGAWVESERAAQIARELEKNKGQVQAETVSKEQTGSKDSGEVKNITLSTENSSVPSPPSPVSPPKSPAAVDVVEDQKNDP